VPGTLTYSTTSDEPTTVDVPSSGTFRVEVEPGTYHLDARYVDGTRCSGTESVPVAAGKERSVDFQCPTMGDGR
jgi:hypothetical protein